MKPALSVNSSAHSVDSPPFKTLNKSVKNDETDMPTGYYGFSLGNESSIQCKEIVLCFFNSPETILSYNIPHQNGGSCHGRPPTSQPSPGNQHLGTSEKRNKLDIPTSQKSKYDKFHDGREQICTHKHRCHPTPPSAVTASDDISCFVLLCTEIKIISNCGGSPHITTPLYELRKSPWTSHLVTARGVTHIYGLSRIKPAKNDHKLINALAL
ncbi:hypothetical protein CDAR_35331 [Caerostris darwini]|uniref:Uncharacterized protein n=1 Tax=Caerostris darwini TaxID=1538125 RepID=A0AAV4SPH1_9ARAC|nr:hypothetical protein CDAR_35331 [Caerostris darwini]